MRNNQLIPLVGALALGLGVAGCSKKQTASSTLAAAPVIDPSQSQAEQEASFQEWMQVKDLEVQVDAYKKIKKRKPDGFEEMVKEGFLDSLPPAPPGKRFALDPATARVSLVPR